MKSILKLVLAFFIFTLAFSCVPTKKYAELERESMRNKRQRDSLNAIVDKNRYLQHDVKRLGAQVEKDKKNLEELESRFGALTQNNQDLLFRYNQLLAQNSEILDVSSTEKQTLTEELAAKQAELDKKERELARIEDSIQQQQADLAQLQAALKEKEAQLSNVDGQFSAYEEQLQQLQATLEQKDATLLALRQSVNKALLGFTESDLTVSEKNGKIYVSLSQNLLFASGSDRIDWKGKKAIIQLAPVLKDNPDILINVEGHTDAVGSTASNWDLSVQRATSVVKVLTGQGVDPKRITASGRALYDPVAPNNSTANKALNRRTEIILTPNLDKLYEIINQ